MTNPDTNSNTKPEKPPQTIPDLPSELTITAELESSSRLTVKRRAFIEHYFLCGYNATEAARRAGYKHPRILGSRLTKVDAVKKVIEKRFSESIMSRDEVLKRLAEQATADYSQYLTGDGTVDLKQLLADGKGHLIKQLSHDRRGNLVVKFHDPQRALELVGKSHAAFTDRVEVRDWRGDMDDGGAAEVFEEMVKQAVESLAGLEREEG